MATFLAFIRGIPGAVKLLLEIISLGKLAYALLRDMKEEKEEADFGKELKKNLKDISKLPVEEKRAAVKKANKALRQ